MLAETPVTHRSPCYFAVSASLINPLPDCSNYLPFCLTHYLHSPDQHFTSLTGQTLYQAATLETITSVLYCSSLLQNLVRNSGIMQCLEEAEQQAEASVDVPPLPYEIVISVLFCLFTLYFFSAHFSILSILPFLISTSLSTSLLSLLINSLSSKDKDFKFFIQLV